MADPKPGTDKKAPAQRLEEVTRNPNRLQQFGQAAVRPFIALLQIFMNFRDQYPGMTKKLGVLGVTAALAWGGWTAWSSYDQARQADISAHRTAIVQAMGGTEYGRSVANLDGRDGKSVYLQVGEDGEAKSVWTRDELLTLYRSMEAERSGVSRRDDCMIRNWNDRDTACGPNAPDPLTRPMR